MPWSPRRIAFLLAMSLVAVSCDATAADFAVLHPFPLPGDGGWDYLVVDAPSNRLFIARDDRVQVVDVGEDASGWFAVRQTVATQRGARTMALHAEDHRVYLVSATFDEEPSPDGQRPRRTMRPGMFTLLVVGAPR